MRNEDNNDDDVNKDLGWIQQVDEYIQKFKWHNNIPVRQNKSTMNDKHDKEQTVLKVTSNIEIIAFN